MDARRFLLVENKPAASGGTKEIPYPVGGELLPMNTLQAVTANLWWLLLLVLPLLLIYIIANHGVRLPSPVRRALMLIPAVVRMFR